MQNREALLNSIGKFNEKKKLKQLARQGQSMSSSTFIAEVPNEDVHIIKDVERNGYTFSDGSGYLSEALFAEVAEVFDVYQVSAIQMRYSGYKGVLMKHRMLGDSALKRR